MTAHLLLVVRAVMLATTVAAVLLARRLPSHRPFAVALVVQTVVMLARWALLEFYLRGAIAAAGGDVAAAVEPAPLHGLALVAGVAMNSGWLVGPAGLAAVSLWVFAGHGKSTREGHASFVMMIWLLAVAFILGTYPAGRPLYPRLFAFAEVAAVVAGLGSAGSWAMRAWGREGLGVTRACVLFMVGCGAVTLAGPYVHGVFTSWWLANAVQLVMYSGLALFQGGALWMLSRSR